MAIGFEINSREDGKCGKIAVRERINYFPQPYRFYAFPANFKLVHYLFPATNKFEDVS